MLSCTTAGRRAALKGGPAGCRKRQAAEQGGLHIYTCRRAVEKGGSFDSRTDCVKNYFFSQLQMFIALYNMAERSMQGRTALNIIEIASFRRSSRCATWRGDETNTSPLKFNLQFVNMRKHFNAFSSYKSEETRHYFCTIV